MIPESFDREPDGAQVQGGPPEAGAQAPEAPECRCKVQLAEQALGAFRRDLPHLLKEHSRQWVAYHGDQPIGFATTKTELYQDCLQRGLRPSEFLICSIEPDADDMTIGPRALE